MTRVATVRGNAVPWHERYQVEEVIPALVLALVAVGAVSQSVALGNWARGTSVLPWIALPAVIIGVVLGRWRVLPGWIAHVVSALLALLWTVWRLGPLLISEVARDFGPAAGERLNSWRDQASELIVRLLSWTRILQAGGRGEDIVLFVCSLALLFWALGYGSGWLLARHNRAWPVILVNGAVALVNYNYASPKQTTLFFVFLAAALLLIVTQQVAQQRKTWQASRLDVPPFLGARFVAAAALACGFVVLGTSLLPSNISNAQLVRAWQLISAPLVALRDGWDTAFSTSQAPPGTSGTGFTTRTVRVGGARVLSDEIVMKVRSVEADYWRAVTFDQYTGTGWQSTVGERARAQLGALTTEDARTPVAAGVRLAQSDIAGRTVITQTFQLVQQRNDRLIMSGGQLDSAGVPIQVQNSFVDDGNGGLRPNFTDMTSVVAERTLEAGATYTVTALISDVDEASLRAAGDAYPQWVRQSYLQLPDSITQRTRDLARNVVANANATNPYDQAVAIQDELRKLTYDERRPAPLDGSDWVDQFLFETRRGYCDDFSTSFIVMARSLGIPARWAQGYTNGQIEPETGMYVVRQGMAHSWPEVYFPGYGWQRFEPTPAAFVDIPSRPAVSSSTAGGNTLLPSRDPQESEEDALRRLREQNLVPEGGEDAAVMEELQRQIAEGQRQAQIQYYATIVAIIAAILGLIVGARWLWLRDLRTLGPAAATYARLGRVAWATGLRQRPDETPEEFAATLGRAMPATRRTFERIARAYAAERYGARTHENPASMEAEWRVARSAIFRRVRNKLRLRKK